MPLRPTVITLRRGCMQAIAVNYEKICYGCSSRSEMNYLLDVDNDEENGYKDFPGPFLDFPSSLLEDLLAIMDDKRKLPKQMLHQIIQPQLESYTISYKTSRHIQTQLISQKCKKLRKIEFRNSKSIAPNFYVKFFKQFPSLVIINVEGTILDNESFDSIGENCIHLRELNAAGSTITDTGLQYLSVDVTKDGRLRPRCSCLMSINIENTRTSPAGVAQFLYFHPNLVYLHYENFSPVFEHIISEDFINVTNLQNKAKFLPAFNLRKLSFVDDKVSEKGFTSAISSCPFLDTLVVRKTDLSSYLLSELMSVSTITTLHLGNSAYSRHNIQFDVDIIPILWTLGNKLTSLNLEKFSKIDVMQIGTLCPKLKYLRLSCMGSYVPVFDQSKAMYQDLEELELLNTRGAHVYSKAVHQILDFTTKLKHAKFQFVDTLNDEVWNEILNINPLSKLETITFDQCHSISVYTLEEFINKENNLSVIECWSCRFITENDRKGLEETIKSQNFAIYLSWYPFTGEEAPMPLDDIEDSEDEDMEILDEEEDEHEFLNYWNEPPLPGRALVNPALD